MDAQKLYYFVIAAQTQHFRQAAERCMVAQPVLSRQIAALEQELGVALFERVSKRVRLSRAGEEFLPYARAALEQLEQGRRAMLDFSGGLRGSLAIGCVEPLASTLLPQLFARFRASHPAVRLRVSVQGSAELLDAVEQGALDLGLLGLSFEQPHVPQALAMRELFRSRLHAILPIDHGLAGTGEITLAQLAGEPLVLFHEGFVIRRVLNRRFAEQGLSGEIIVEIGLLEGLLACIRAGLGISVLPPRLVPAPFAHELAALPIRDLHDEFAVGLVYHRFAPPTPAAGEFIKSFSV